MVIAHLAVNPKTHQVVPLQYHVTTSFLWTHHFTPFHSAIPIDRLLSERQSQQKADRKSLTLYQHPLRVLSLFTSVATEYLRSLCHQLLSSPLIMTVLVPLLLIIGCHFVFRGEIQWIEFMYIRIEWTLWWLILGLMLCLKYDSDP